MTCDDRGRPGLQPTPAPTGPLRFQLRLTSDPRLLAVVRSVVSEFAAVWAFDDEACRRITLAVDEALSNIIRHAYKNQCDREIELDCEARSDCVEFTLVDHGEPLDPARFCSQPLDAIAIGGRGTHLIRQIMDEVRYERVAEGNRLCLRKYLPGARSKA